jgi:glutathione synthase/RimK-type ligase-like ATP-grasp enzyme
MDRPTTSSKPSRLALMWRGNPNAPDQPASHATRLLPLVTELRKLSIEPEPLVYFDDQVEAARRQLEAVDGALVWINPLADGRDRTLVDALLREVSAKGVWVSTHPDTILKMGTKEVLYQTRTLGWGSDTDLYDTFDAFALRFPVKLKVAGARVLKPLRGNDGQGVTKVEPAGDKVCVQAASDDSLALMPLRDFIASMRHRFDNGAHLIDQAFQPNVSAGMVRCYMTQDRVAGFSEQFPRTRDAATPAFGMNSAKTMHGADVEAFADLRKLMETDWTPGLQRIFGLDTSSLPALWDADFLYRAAPLANEPRFVLCEINVSSVSPFPDAAAPAVASTVRRMLDRR